MLLTCWQVEVEGRWKYATADVAAMVAVYRPGCVRLSAMKAPTVPRFERMQRCASREITNRRLAASKRRLRLEREAVPLFADHVAVEQPTPEERIRRIDEGVNQNWTEMRKRRAESWRRIRARLRALHSTVRARVLLEHAEMGSPGTPESVGYVIDKRAGMALVAEVGG